MAADIVIDVEALAGALGLDVKTLTTKVGSLPALNTTNKASLVAAINEVLAGAQSAAGIDDNATGTTSTWSSSKTDTEITDATAAVKAEILGGAGAAYDTLEELKALLDASDTADDNAIAAINTALGNRVRTDAAQGLTTGQKTQARDNIDAASVAQVNAVDTKLGNVAAMDLVATYNAAKA